MMTLQIVLTVLLSVAFCLSMVFIYKAYHAWRIGQELAKEIDNIIHDALVESTLPPTIAPESAPAKKTAEDYLADIETPEMLTTLLTALVKKCGSIGVSLNDFLAIEEDDFISIYVNRSTQTLILSTDHDLEEKSRMGTEDPFVMGNFSEPDDTTYH